jgi:hypothetical protein
MYSAIPRFARGIRRCWALRMSITFRAFRLAMEMVKAGRQVKLFSRKQCGDAVDIRLVVPTCIELREGLPLELCL